MTILPSQASFFSSIYGRAVSAFLAALLLSGVASSKPQAPALTVGIPVERSLLPGGQDEVSLDLQAGFYLRLALYGRGAELNASLISPDGEVVARDDGEEEGRLAHITKTGGVYRIAVTSPKAKIAIQYQLRLAALRPAVRPDDETRLAADAALLAARQEEEPAKAVQKGKAALQLWSDLEDVDGEVEALETLAVKDEECTLAWYEEALSRARAGGRPALEAKARTDLGEVLLRRGSFEGARLELEAALSLLEVSGDAYQQARALYNLGFGSFTLGRLDESSRFYDQALRLTKPAWDITPDIQNGLCNVYAARGESRKAFDCLDQAFKLARETGRTGAEAAVRTTRGLLHLRRGEASAALEEVTEALRIDQSDPDLQKYVGKVLGNLGFVYLGLGQPQEALANFQRALGSSRQVNDQVWTANMLASIGRADLILSQPAEALKNFQAALAMAADKARPRANALQGIGMAELQLQQVTQAIGHLKEALEIQAVVDHPGQALTQQTLGKAFQKQG
ncbi:MAG TPA: tetratricopeptide repeat protein, partial [Thermoanaerobaculia bacterium]